MAVRLKIEEVRKIAPEIEELILDGLTKSEICKELDIFAGAVHTFMKYFGTDELGKKLLANGRGA